MIFMKHKFEKRKKERKKERRKVRERDFLFKQLSHANLVQELRQVGAGTKAGR